MSIPTETIADVQSSVDARDIAIDQVGVRDVRHPIQVIDSQGVAVSSVANFNMSVNLPPQQKGTHMSRFIALLHEYSAPFSVQNFNNLALEMVRNLDADHGLIEMNFLYFRRKTAPVSQQASYLDYNVTFIARVRDKHQVQTDLKVVVPVTSLCPCSKAISKYGAHNQRSHITVTIESVTPVFIDELIDLIESQASSELYGLIKRADEKYVTERAYENPKFVEDLVRDIAQALKQDHRITAYKIASENFESIHNHSAYAMIQSNALR